MKEKEKIYLACALDTEGTIRMDKDPKTNSSLRVDVILVNSDRKWIDYLYSLMGEKTKIMVRDKGKKYKILHELHWSAERIRKLLPQIFPYLIIKKRHAKIAIEFAKIREKAWKKYGYLSPVAKYGKREWQIFEEMKKLNKKGR